LNPELVIIDILWGLKSWDLGAKQVLVPNPTKSVFINNLQAGFGEIDRFSNPVTLLMTETSTISFWIRAISQKI
jgi:hypothetical protein